MQGVASAFYYVVIVLLNLQFVTGCDEFGYKIQNLGSLPQWPSIGGCHFGRDKTAFKGLWGKNASWKQWPPRIISASPATAWGMWLWPVHNCNCTSHQCWKQLTLRRFHLTRQRCEATLCSVSRRKPSHLFHRQKRKSSKVCLQTFSFLCTTNVVDQTL